MMYYYYHHPQNRGIHPHNNQLLSQRSNQLEFSSTHIKSSESGVDNKTETLEGQDWIVEVEDVRNISVIEIVCAVSPLAVRRRGGTIICLIFPWCGGRDVRYRYHYDPYPQYLHRDKIISSTHWILDTSHHTHQLLTC